MDVKAGQAEAGMMVNDTGTAPAGRVPVKSASMVPLRLKKLAVPFWKAGLDHTRLLPKAEKVVEMSPMTEETLKGANDVPVPVETRRPPLLIWPATMLKTDADPQSNVLSAPPATYVGPD